MFAACLSVSRLCYVPAVLVFGWASLMQHRCYVKLARLRRNRMGEC